MERVAAITHAWPMTGTEIERIVVVNIERVQKVGALKG
jgi:hypothetical protein